MSTLKDLLAVAKKAKCEAVTKEVAMYFLETGKQPSFTKTSKTKAAKKKKSAKKTKAAKRRPDRWPFAALPVQANGDSRVDHRHARKPRPHFDVLIQLSIKQRDAKSVLRWYDELQASKIPKRLRFDRIQTQVADAISSTYPDRAVELYCMEADRLAAETNTKLYPESVALLKKARKVLTSHKRAHEFEVVLENFHDRHQRKSRLVELLHGLQGKPIVSKRRRNR